MLFLVRPDVKSIHLLADLLEMIQVSIDEMLDQRLAPAAVAVPGADGDSVWQHLAAQRDFVDRLRALEVSIIAKLEQARTRARSVSRTDWRLRPLMVLFNSSTQAFADQIAALGDSTADSFDRGDQTLLFLRSREIVAPNAMSVAADAELVVTESYRLCGVLRLRELLEKCESTLNALDAHYDLFEWDEEDGEEATGLEQPVALAASADPATVAGQVTGNVEAEPAIGELPVEVPVDLAPTAQPTSPKAAAEVEDEGGEEAVIELTATAAASPATAAPLVLSSGSGPVGGEPVAAGESKREIAPVAAEPVPAQSATPEMEASAAAADAMPDAVPTPTATGGAVAESPREGTRAAAVAEDSAISDAPLAVEAAEAAKPVASNRVQEEAGSSPAPVAPATAGAGDEERPAAAALASTPQLATTPSTPPSAEEQAVPETATGEETPPTPAEQEAAVQSLKSLSERLAAVAAEDAAKVPEGDAAKSIAAA